MRKTKSRTSSRGKRGQGLLEFALILPILLLLVLGIIEFGYVFMAYSSLFNASREGTRYGVVQPKDQAGIVSRARSAIYMVDPNAAGIGVRYDSGPGTAVFTDTDSLEVGVSRVVVELTYDLPAITPIVRPFNDTFHLQAHSARTIAVTGALTSTYSSGSGGGTEICTGGVDEDGDGDIDCADSDCVGDPACSGPPPASSVSISKDPGSQTVVEGSNATFDITVTNNGGTNLTGVTVSDPQTPDCDSNIGSLAAGGSTSYSCTATNVVTDFTNTATVDTDQGVSDSASASVTVIPTGTPLIQIIKSPSTQTVVAGSDATFDITITNVGSVELTNVTVSDDQADSCTSALGNIGTLSIGNSWSTTCTATNVVADFTNTATVNTDEGASDSASASVTVVQPTLVPLYLDKPLVVGDPQISGGGEPGQQVVLRDLQAREEIGTVVIDGSRRFTLNFALDASRLGHTIVAIGYGQVDYAEVLGGTPTNTPTPTTTPTTTPTPTPTPTPAGAFITLSAECGDTPGTVSLTVYGHNWQYQNSNDDITIEWNGAFVKTVSAAGELPSWNTLITVEAVSGTNTVRAHNKSDASATYEVPCPATSTPTPTPTPAPPDIVVDSVAPVGLTIYAGQPAAFDVTVRNQGTSPVNSLFWNDLFIDPADPVSSQSLHFALGSSGNVDWGGISSLGPGASLTIRLTYYAGFATAGDHTVFALGDSLGPEGQVAEMLEDNNHSGTTVTVLEPLETPTPTDTPTPTPTPGGPTPTPTPVPGSISGATWIWVGSNWTVPQGRVTVRCWQDETLVATTYSEDGYYLLSDIPVGTGYKVTGEIWVDGTRYYDERTSITVDSGVETRYVDLLLVPTAPTAPTDTPTPTPTDTPAPSWVTLTYDDFETDMGSYTCSGDCSHYTGLHAHQGNGAAAIERGAYFDHSSAIDVDTPGYTEIRVVFWFKTDAMESGDAIGVDYYNGSTWIPIATYNCVTDFNDGVFDNRSVTISEASYTFPSNMRMRFWTTAGNNEFAYFDEIRVEAR